MWSRGIWLFLFSAATAVIAPTFAKADIVGGECYGTLTVLIHCSNSEGCKDIMAIDSCITGTDGSLCNSGYGLCCGSPFEEHNASQDCEDVRRASKHSGSSRAGGANPIALRPPINSVSDLSLRVIFVPDRCAHSYGVIDPGAFKKTSGGI
jgi:hypothetical protein